MHKIESTERDRANALVRFMGEQVGVHNASLDNTDERGFGDFGLRYQPDRHVLTVIIFVARAYATDPPQPGEQASFKRIGVALRDPKIGGMFEQGGGYFVHDEVKKKFLLEKDFPVDTIRPEELKTEVEDLLDLGAMWSQEWLIRVIRIVKGKQLPPQHLVTRKNDPKY
jgi:hypothetical protein